MKLIFTFYLILISWHQILTLPDQKEYKSNFVNTMSGSILQLGEVGGLYCKTNQVFQGFQLVEENQKIGYNFWCSSTTALVTNKPNPVSFHRSDWRTFDKEKSNTQAYKLKNLDVACPDNMGISQVKLNIINNEMMYQYTCVEVKTKNCKHKIETVKTDALDKNDRASTFLLAKQKIRLKDNEILTGFRLKVDSVIKTKGKDGIERKDYTKPFQYYYQYSYCELLEDPNQSPLPEVKEEPLPGHEIAHKNLSPEDLRKHLEDNSKLSGHLSKKTKAKIEAAKKEDGTSTSTSTKTTGGAHVETENNKNDKFNKPPPEMAPKLNEQPPSQSSHISQTNLEKTNKAQPPLQSINNELKNLKIEVETEKQKNKQLTVELEKKNDELKKLNEKISNLEKNENHWKNISEQERKKYSEKESLSNKENERLKREVASIQAKLKISEEQIHQLKNEKIALEKQVNKLLEENGKLVDVKLQSEAKNKKNTNEIDAIKENKKKLLKTKDDLEAKMKKLKEQKKKLLDDKEKLIEEKKIKEENEKKIKEEAEKKLKEEEAKRKSEEEKKREEVENRKKLEYENKELKKEKDKLEKEKTNLEKQLEKTKNEAKKNMEESQIYIDEKRITTGTNPTNQQNNNLRSQISLNSDTSSAQQQQKQPVVIIKKYDENVKQQEQKDTKGVKIITVNSEDKDKIRNSTSPPSFYIIDKSDRDSNIKKVEKSSKIPGVNIIYANPTI